MRYLPLHSAYRAHRGLCKSNSEFGFCNISRTLKCVVVYRSLHYSHKILLFFFFVCLHSPSDGQSAMQPEKPLASVFINYAVHTRIAKLYSVPKNFMLVIMSVLVLFWCCECQRWKVFVWIVFFFCGVFAFSWWMYLWCAMRKQAWAI